jgi:hypothetical protein
MKIFLSILSVFFLMNSVSAQKIKQSEVPTPVIASMNKMHPEIKDAEWTMEDGNYEAEYDLDKMEASVTFDASGNLLETEKEIAVSTLPSGVAEYVAKNYDGKSIKEASEITDSKGAKTYEAEIKGMDLVFDAKGNFLKIEKD